MNLLSISGIACTFLGFKDGGEIVLGHWNIDGIYEPHLDCLPIKPTRLTTLVHSSLIWHRWLGRLTISKIL